MVTTLRNTSRFGVSAGLDLGSAASHYAHGTRCCHEGQAPTKGESILVVGGRLGDTGIRSANGHSRHLRDFDSRRQ